MEAEGSGPEDAIQSLSGFCLDPRILGADLKAIHVVFHEVIIQIGSLSVCEWVKEGNETVSFSVVLSSYAGGLASVVQRGSEEFPGGDWAIVMVGGSGYFPLQEDPTDFTIGGLERDG